MKNYRVKFTFCCPGISDGNDYMTVAAETPEQAEHKCAEYIMNSSGMYNYICEYTNGEITVCRNDGSLFGTYKNIKAITNKRK